MTRSGWSILCVVEFKVWNSIVFICAAETRASTLSTASIAAWPGQSFGSSSRRPGTRVSACFWKNSSPVMPSGARTSETGRSRKCGRIRSAMLS